jgi:protein prenyltransferase alpha subunit repeat containing protein 1
MSSPPPDYTTLTTFFNTHSHTPTQISLLPAPHTEILISPPHLGIPKKCLVSAFTYARQLLLTSFSGCDTLAIRDATSILILTASEHLTALNTRKRLLVSSHVASELVWLESLLTSPLPRHNKSPLLWAHRKWVLEKFPQEASMVTVESELAMVRKSAEVHPRNYYAWGHARWAVEHLLGKRSEIVMNSVVETHLGFCWRHAEDVGVWAFLEWLLVRWEQREGALESLINEIVAYARDVAPGHESVWCVLRSLVGRAGVLAPEARARVMSLLERRVEGMGEDSKRELELEERAVAWIKRFGDCNSPLESA